MLLSCRKILFLITGIFLLTGACEKDQIEPAYTDGVLKGKTFYYGTYPLYLTFPLENVKVKAIGPYGARTAVTDANGEYEIKNVGNGTYEIEYSKEGWGATKHYSVQVYGNEVLTYDARMWKYPEFDMPVLQIDKSKGYVIFRSNLFPGTGDVPELRAFFGGTKEVNCYQYDYTDYVFDYTDPDYIYYNFRLTPEPGGKTVYVVFYLIANGDNGDYDPYRALTIYPSINPKKHSPVFKYDIP